MMNENNSIIGILLGLGFFLFGIKFLSYYFRSLFSKRIRDNVQHWIKNDFSAFIVGTLLITVTQSVTAIMILLVNLIKNNVLSKSRAIPLIIGSNIGSFFIIFLVSLNIIAAIVIVLGISGIIYALSDRKSIQAVAGTLFGIGCLFYGLYHIQIGAVPFSEMANKEVFEFAKEIFFVEFMLGVILSFLMHSSIVVVILAISLAKAGYFDLEEMIILTYGANIGTALLIYISTLQVQGETKQLISFQLFYKFVATIILLPIFYIEHYTHIPMITAGIGYLTKDVGLQATLAYFLFNAIPILFIIPFKKEILNYLEKKYPKSLEDVYSKPQFVVETKYIDPTLILELIGLEQIRIIKTFNIYFEELRGRGDVKKLKQLAKSTKILGDFIREEIAYMLTEKNLSLDDFSLLNELLVRQHIIDQCYDVLLRLSTYLLQINKFDKYKNFFRSVVESMDIISLMVLDIIAEHDKSDLDLLKRITSTHAGGIANMRRIYFSEGEFAEKEERSLVLFIINQCEILSFLLKDVAKTYIQRPTADLKE